MSVLTGAGSTSCEPQFCGIEVRESSKAVGDWKSACTAGHIRYSDRESQDIFFLITEVLCKNFCR